MAAKYEGMAANLAAERLRLQSQTESLSIFVMRQQLLVGKRIVESMVLIRVELWRGKTAVELETVQDLFGFGVGPVDASKAIRPLSRTCLLTYSVHLSG
jgi:hypothetical protein